MGRLIFGVGTNIMMPVLLTGAVTVMLVLLMHQKQIAALGTIASVCSVRLEEVETSNGGGGHGWWGKVH